MPHPTQVCVSRAGAHRRANWCPHPSATATPAARCRHLASGAPPLHPYPAADAALRHSLVRVPPCGQRGVYAIRPAVPELGGLRARAWLQEIEGSQTKLGKGARSYASYSLGLRLGLYLSWLYSTSWLKQAFNQILSDVQLSLASFLACARPQDWSLNTTWGPAALTVKWAPLQPSRTLLRSFPA